MRLGCHSGVAVGDSRGRVTWVGDVAEDGLMELEGDDTSVQRQPGLRNTMEASAFVVRRFEHMPEFHYGGLPCFRNPEKRSSVLARHGVDDEIQELVGVEDRGSGLVCVGSRRSSKVGRPSVKVVSRHFYVLRMFDGVKSGDGFLVCDGASDLCV